MFSLFKTKKVQEPAYTAEEIHGVIVAKNLALLSNMIELTKKDLVKAPTNVAFEYSILILKPLSTTKILDSTSRFVRIRMDSYVISSLVLETSTQLSKADL